MTADKVQIGGIGVSGATADQDETCAQAGICCPGCAQIVSDGQKPGQRFRLQC